MSSGIFDTHCHLNFEAFDKQVSAVISAAKAAGISYIVIPGTDVKTSIAGVAIAERFAGIYAAIGIHPHHVFSLKSANLNDKSLMQTIEKLLPNKKVVAIGEVGLDRHYYEQTKYKNYETGEDFIALQKKLLAEQINLALKYKKSLILHNREAKNDTIEVLEKKWNRKLEGKTVFHCCEPDQELLNFAQKHKIFIGVDGDVTYRTDKQEFVKKIPLDLLVLETDSPFLKPAGYKFPNQPKNLKAIADFLAQINKTSANHLIDVTTKNAKRLFSL